MPTTINRAALNALVDDDGSNTLGSPWNKSAIASVIMDAIDALFTVPFSVASTLTVGGQTTVTGAVQVIGSTTSPPSGSWAKHPDFGLIGTAVAGASHDFAIVRPAAGYLPILRVPTGTSHIQLGGAAEFTVDVGSPPSASWAKNGIYGLVATSIVGSTYDFAILRPAAGYQGILRVPTGTANVEFLGTISNMGHGTTASAANMFIDSGSGLISRSTSSLRYKADVADIPLARVADLLDLRPVSFRSLSSIDAAKDPTRRFIGLIAEEVHAVFPELIELDTQGRPDEVSYGRLPVLLLLACRVLRNRLATLTERVTALEAA